MLNKNFPTHRRFPLPNVSTFLTHTYMNNTNPWPWGAWECLDNVNVSTLKLSPSFLTTGLLQLKPKLQTPIFTALKLGLKLLLSIPNVLAPGFHNFNCATKLHPKQNRTQNKITHTLTRERERELGTLVHSESVWWHALILSEDCEAIWLQPKHGSTMRVWMVREIWGQHRHASKENL